MIRPSLFANCQLSKSGSNLHIEIETGVPLETEIQGFYLLVVIFDWDGSLALEENNMGCKTGKRL